MRYVWNHFEILPTHMQRVKGYIQEYCSHIQRIIDVGSRHGKYYYLPHFWTCSQHLFLNVTTLAFLSWLVLLLPISVPVNNSNNSEHVMSDVLSALHVLFNHPNNSVSCVLVLFLSHSKKLRSRGFKQLHKVILPASGRVRLQIWIYSSATHVLTAMLIASHPATVPATFRYIFTKLNFFRQQSALFFFTFYNSVNDARVIFFHLKSTLGSSLAVQWPPCFHCRGKGVKP